MKTSSVIQMIFSSFLIIMPSFYSITKAADYVNSIGMEFNNIKAGSFYMGTCLKDIAENKKRQFKGLPPLKQEYCSHFKFPSKNEFPRHKVTISKDFQMGVYEVTLGQFKQFYKEIYLNNSGKISSGKLPRLKLAIENNGRACLPNRKEFYRSSKKAQRELIKKTPVMEIDWKYIIEFISWLNKNEEGEFYYRLPTEAEWEYAARAGTTTDYSFGNHKGQLREYAWFKEDDKSCVGDYPVGLKKPNSWGLYDMYGNVAEIVSDWYDFDYYKISPAKDPKGPDSVKKKRKVTRGGSSAQSGEYDLRSAKRSSVSRDLGAGALVGFRLVRQKK